MKRIVAAIALAVGLVAGTAGFAQPAAAAYNTAPASHICAYWQPTWTLFESRDFDYGGSGFYYAHVYCRWRFTSASCNYEAEGMYRRRDGYHVVYNVQILSCF